MSCLRLALRIRPAAAMRPWRPLSAGRACFSTEEIPLPTPEGEKKEYPQKINQIVDQIAQLNLLEVADLNSCLKERLNISDTPVMMAGVAAGAAPAAAQEEEEEAHEPVAVQTSFTVKMHKFDESKKVALIKELKGQVIKTDFLIGFIN